MRLSSAGDLQLHRLADDIYLYRGYFSNSAIFVLKNSVVVVDTQVSPRAGARLARKIAEVTPLAVKHVINTHYHGDHTGGNAAFEGAEIIGSRDTLRFVGERDSERVEYAETFGLAFQHVHPTIPPARTFEGRLELEIDGEKLEVLQLGRVETPDASVVIWPSRRAVACGDGVATHDYPYLGVPFLDEGLRDDGEWLGFLDKLLEMKPLYLLPGHGPALVGEREIAARLQLLRSLFVDLMGSVKEEMAKGTPFKELVERVDKKLARYRRRRDLHEHTVSQRFAIYRCVNNLSPDRKGRGWWDDMRPSVVVRASVEDANRELARVAEWPDVGRAVRWRGKALAEIGEAPLAIAVLERWLSENPKDAGALAVLSDVFFDCARGVSPKVDATEYIARSTRAAREALAIDPEQPLAILSLACAEVFGGMVLAQPMDAAIAKLEQVLAAGGLTTRQRMRAMFFLGRAHQMEDRTEESDRAYREILPAWARFLYPLVRDRIRSYP